MSFLLYTVYGFIIRDLSIDLSMYVCHAMDPGNPEVTMLEEPISHLHFLAHCDVIEQPAKTDTLTFSVLKGLKAS